MLIEFPRRWIPGTVALFAVLLLGITGCSTGAERANVPFELKTVSYAAESSPVLADIYVPRTEAGEALRPGILVLHGGSWQRGNKERKSDVAQYLASRGYVVMNANYRLAPEYSLAEQLHDVAAALQFMKKNAGQWQMDPHRIAMIGFSAGGHLALLSALSDAENRHPVAAVAAVGAPTDLTAYGDITTMHRLLRTSYDAHPEIYQNASPLYQVHANAPPILLVHGTYDWIVPVNQARRMAEALRHSGAYVDLVELPNGHMTTTFNMNEESMAAITQFLEKQFAASVAASDQSTILR
ncbi:MAG: alpha/beta hydrolase [Leptospiraceae bacterium]|nr:alpha/beta hydrolase [Leptospiraceae bacterium]